MINLNSAWVDSQTLKHSIDLLGQSEVNFSVLLSLALKCGAAKDLQESKRLHAYLIEQGLHRNLRLANSLLRMYLCCGSLGDVVDCFLAMYERNELSWNFFIAAYARDGKHEHAVCAFWQMQSQAFLPNEYIFASVIAACSNTVAIMNGKKIHTQFTESDYRFCVPVLNALANMYAKCFFLSEARMLFDQVECRNVISWTSMISAYSHHGWGDNAIFLYFQMCQEGVLPNVVTFTSLLGACVSPDWLMEGKKLHACLVGCNCQSEFVLAVALLNMYGNCGSLNDAHDFFATLIERDTIVWTSMMRCCVKQGQPEMAPQLYDRMLSEGELPDAIAYSSVLDGCVSEHALRRGKHVHTSLVTELMPLDVAVSLSLMNMYGRLGDLKEARLIFNKIISHDTVSWTSLIAVYVEQGETKRAIQLFLEMQVDGVPPDKFTFLRVADACANEVAVKEGRWVHHCIVEDSLESDSILATSLILMYFKFENTSEAQYVFYEMQERSLFAWTAMITGCLQCDTDNVALSSCNQMQQEGLIPNRAICICILSACANVSCITKGKSLHIFIAHSDFFQDVVVTTALISMYGKCHYEDDAKRIFEQMTVRNVISWNAMLAAYCYCECGERALNLFEQMHSQCIIPNKVSCVSILDVCARWQNLSKGRIIHSLAVKSGYDLDVDTGNVIINMYGKCGRPKESHKVFEQMPLLDIVSWNTIIVLWAQHGSPNFVFVLLQRMLAKGHLPDNITYVAVLHVCCHAGLIIEAVHYFTYLMKTQEVTPSSEICHCMISVLAYAGLMQEADNLLENLPIQPTDITWTSLFNACRSHIDINRGECIVGYVIELDEGNSSPYVMLANMYSANKNKED